MSFPMLNLTLARTIHLVWFLHSAMMRPLSFTMRAQIFSILNLSCIYLSWYSLVPNETSSSPYPHTFHASSFTPDEFLLHSFRGIPR